jgi:hypothetical protein
MSAKVIRLAVTRTELLWIQDAVDDIGPLPQPASDARLLALQCKLHALTGEELPPSRRCLRLVPTTGKGGV